jgi:hypothetical protein
VCPTRAAPGSPVGYCYEGQLMLGPNGPQSHAHLSGPELFACNQPSQTVRMCCRGHANDQPEVLVQGSQGSQGSQTCSATEHVSSAQTTSGSHQPPVCLTDSPTEHQVGGDSISTCIVCTGTDWPDTEHASPAKVCPPPLYSGNSASAVILHGCGNAILSWSYMMNMMNSCSLCWASGAVPTGSSRAGPWQ